jgi:predicted PurR-regulated permease PerM
MKSKIRDKEEKAAMWVGIRQTLALSMFLWLFLILSTIGMRYIEGWAWLDAIELNCIPAIGLPLSWIIPWIWHYFDGLPFPRWMYGEGNGTSTAGQWGKAGKQYN